MFTCPEKDIHSIYLDNELPEAYLKQYESHIQSCEKCRLILAKTRRLRSLFETDSKSLNLDGIAMDESYRRLQSRLAFRKITAMSGGRKKSARDFLKYCVPAAAAAVLVLAVLPFSFKRSQAASPQSAENLQILSKSKPAPIAENNVIITGNGAESSFVRLSAAKAQDNQHGATFVQYADIQSQKQKMREALAAIDVFSPEFDDSNSIQIQITIPTVMTIPISEGYVQP